MTDSSVLADLRDQIVRLQQQWREEARAECEDQLPGWFGAQSKLTACADELDPLLTLVRSLVEHGQETETEK
jgi:hypothetical protein